MTDDAEAEAFRPSVSLDGQWRFVTDPDDTGTDAGWQGGDVDWPDRETDVEVPHVWQEMDGYREYTGKAWYRRTVDVDEDRLRDRDAVLRFGAADYETTVWVNGRFVGTNHGGYLPFEFDVTGAFTPDENTITVAVTDPADLSEVPHGKQGDPWYTRVSGIWQSVGIEFRPPTRVESARVTPDLATDTADVEVRIAGLETEHGVECVVSALRDGETVATARVDGSEQTAAVLDFDDPAYWTPDEPALYDLEVVLRRDGAVVDRYCDYFGFRSFRTDDGEFLLNGEPITMRGVLEQGYYPKTLYRPPDDDTFEHEVRVAKDLGFNLIRKHIKPAHPDFLEEADRQGILVWQEPASPSRYTDPSTDAVIEQLHGMIDRDYNRPSVVVWSLYNEEWGIGHHDAEETLWTDVGKQQFLGDLYQSIRERDPTRVVCDNSGWAHVATDVNDFHRYFASPDRAGSWEADLDHICFHAEDNYATTEFDDPDAPIVISELGTWGLGDVSALRDAYDGDPPWFFHDFLTPSFKQPDGLDEKFADSDIPVVFGDYDALEIAWQWREFVSVKHIIEATREREEIAGYVLTELSDIEWEFNGILNYLREEKVFHDEFRQVNGDVCVIVDPESHVARSGGDLSFDAVVVNDTGTTLSGCLGWTLGGEETTTTVTVDPHAIRRIETPSLDLPDPDGTVNIEELTATFDGRTAGATTTEPIHLVDESRASPSATVFAEGAFAARLARTGLDVTHELSASVDVAFTDTMTNEVEQFATNGGAVVHVPSDDGRMVNGGPFSYRDVPEEESWVGVASLFYQDSPLLDDVCDGARLGWEFEGLYPYSVATDLDPSVDQVHVGYVEGWLANWSSPLVVRGYGSGSMTSCTFRIQETYGSHPLGTLLCDRLVEWLAE